jgi:hypothetical protein
VLLKDAHLSLNELNTSLHFACNNGKVEVVKLLIEDGRADVNKVNNDGNAPLHVVCNDWNMKVKIVKMLLEDARVDVNRVNKVDGNTPLHAACRNENVPIIELLVKHGANPFIKNKLNDSPFDVAPNTTKHIMKVCGYIYGHINENLNILYLTDEQFQKLKTEAVKLLNTTEMIGIFASKIFHQNAPLTARLDILTLENMELLINQLKSLFEKSNLSAANSAKKINALKEDYHFSYKNIDVIKSGLEYYNSNVSESIIKTVHCIDDTYTLIGEVGED